MNFIYNFFIALSVAFVCQMAFSQHARADDSLLELMAALSDKNTELRQELLWKKFEGQEIRVTGDVLDVKDAGWILPASVEINPNGGKDRVVVVCYVKYFAVKPHTLNIGSPVGCRGKLASYTLIFNQLALTVDDAKLYRPD